MEDKGLSITNTIIKMESKWKTLHSTHKNSTNSPPTPCQVNLLTADQLVRMSKEDQIKHGWLCPKKKWDAMDFKQKYKFKREQNQKFGHVTPGILPPQELREPHQQHKQPAPSSNYVQANQIVTAFCALCDQVEGNTKSCDPVSANKVEAGPMLRQILQFTSQRNQPSLYYSYSTSCG